MAHLPWRQMTYKFLNTIIDDLFAFVIKMPTLHRLSVFRDDIVFLIYIYQRWIYRVDKKRANEFGCVISISCILHWLARRPACTWNLNTETVYVRGHIRVWEIPPLQGAARRNCLCELTSSVPEAPGLRGISPTGN